MDATTTSVSSERSPSTGGTVPFPSVRWFERLADLMREQHALHEHLGDIDCVAQFTVLDGGPDENPWHAQVTFEGIEVTDVREIPDGSSFDRADFVAEADLETWETMIRSIASGKGRPALNQTLNYLSLPGTPIRVWSDDPVRRDAFFRFNQSLQEFFNASAAFSTEFQTGS